MLLGWTLHYIWKEGLLMRLKNICLHGGAALNHWRIPCSFNTVCLNLNLLMNVRWKIFLLAACRGALRWLAGNSRWPCYQQYRLPLSQSFSVPVSCVSVDGFFCLTPGFSDSWWSTWQHGLLPVKSLFLPAFSEKISCCNAGAETLYTTQWECVLVSSTHPAIPQWQTINKTVSRKRSRFCCVISFCLPFCLFLLAFFPMFQWPFFFACFISFPSLFSSLFCSICSFFFHFL